MIARALARSLEPHLSSLGFEHARGTRGFVRTRDRDVVEQVFLAAQVTPGMRRASLKLWNFQVSLGVRWVEIETLLDRAWSDNPRHVPMASTATTVLQSASDRPYRVSSVDDVPDVAQRVRDDLDRAISSWFDTVSTLDGLGEWLASRVSVDGASVIHRALIASAMRGQLEAAHTDLSRLLRVRGWPRFERKDLDQLHELLQQDPIEPRSRGTR